jgi:flavin-dependent dehydrogenase
VCGEFISGRGQSVLARLGLSEFLSTVNAREARTAVFFGPKAKLGQLELPQPGLCISRFKLDQALANRFRDVGGDLFEGRRWKGSLPDEGFVRATGRVRDTTRGVRWVGLKAHATNLELLAGLEMHLTPSGYIGLCAIEDGTVNVCGLFQLQKPAKDLDVHWCRRMAMGTTLEARLEAAQFDPTSFCAVAGLAFGLGDGAADRAFSVGDSFAVTPPFTGNGMSIAFETAALAVPSILAYTRGEHDWEGAKNEYNGLRTKLLRPRLVWAAVLHRMMFHRMGATVLGLLLRLCPQAGRALFWRTR